MGMMNHCHLYPLHMESQWPLKLETRKCSVMPLRILFEKEARPKAKAG